MTTLTFEDRERLRENAVEGGPWGAVVLDLLDALDQAERERDEARATKDMHKERAERIVRDGEAAIAAVQRVREWAQEASDFYEPAGDTVLALLDGDA